MRKSIFTIFMFALLFTWQQTQAREKHVLHYEDFNKIEQTRVPAVQNQDFSFDVTEVNVDVTKGETFVPPVLNNPDNLEVTYKTSDPGVVYYDVNSNEFDVIGSGSCVVTATASDGSTASYTVNISDPSVVFSAGFAYDLQGFRVESTSNVKNAWDYDSTYGAVMASVDSQYSGYYNTYLISPVITLRKNNCNISIKQAFLNRNYFDIYSNIVIREVGGEWVSINLPDYISDNSFHEYDMIVIPDIFNGKKVELAFALNPTSSFFNFSWAVKHITITEDKRPGSGISFDATEVNYDAMTGAALVVPTLNNPNNVSVDYTSSNPDIVYYDKDRGVFHAIGNGTAVITAKSAATELYSESTARVTVNVNDPTVVYSIGFGYGLRDFDQEFTRGRADWKWQPNSNCAMISTNKYEYEVYYSCLVTPEFTLSNKNTVLSLFSNIGNYASKEVDAKVLIREVGGEWNVIDIPFITDGKPHNYEGINIPEKFNGKKVQIGFKYTADCDEDDSFWAVHTMTIREKSKRYSGIVFNAAEVNYDPSKGEPFEAPVLSNPHEVNVVITSSNPDVIYYDKDRGNFYAIGNGTAVINAKSTATELYLETSASCTVNVSDSMVVYSAGFGDGMRGFRQECSVSGKNDWYWNSDSNCAFITTDRTYGGVYDNYLISPVITLGSRGYLVSLFANFGNCNADDIASKMLIREVGGEWNVLDVPFVSDGQPHSYDGIIIPDSFNGKKVEIGFRYTADGTADNYYWAVHSMTVRVNPKPSPGFSFDVTELNFDATKGEKFEAPKLNNPNNAEVSYSSSNPDVIFYDIITKDFYCIGKGTAVITAKSKENDIYRAGEACCTVNVNDPQAIYSVGFGDGLRGLKQINEYTGKFDWTWNDSCYCIQNTTDKTVYGFYENTLISPEITLSAKDNTLTLVAALQGNLDNFKSSVSVREVGGRWTDINIPYINDNKFHAYNDIRMPESLRGKTVEIGIRFITNGLEDDHVWSVKIMTVREDLRQEPGYSFDVTEVNFDATKGEEFVAPVLNNPNNVEVTYTSSNPDVVFYDIIENKMEAIGNGTAVITAMNEMSDLYRKGSASYTVNVNDTSVVFSAGFGDGLRGFRQESSVTGKNDWSWEKRLNCAVIGTDKEFGGSYDNYLISPEFTLNERGNFLAFSSALSNFTDNEINPKVVIREVGGEWTEIDVPFMIDQNQHHYNGIALPGSLNGKKVELAFRYTADGTTDDYLWAVSTVKVNKDMREDAGISFDVTEVNYDVNRDEEPELPFLNNINNLEVTYESSNTSVAYFPLGSVNLEIIGKGTTVITARSAATDALREGAASYTLNVTDTTSVYSVSFVDGMNGFYAENPENNAWSWNDEIRSLIARANGAVAETTDFYLYSPVFTLSEKGNAIELMHGVINMNDIENQAQLMIREDGGEWVRLDIPYYAEGGFFDYSGRIIVPEQFNGKKVQTAFKYTSDDAAGNMWFITHMKVNSCIPAGLSFDVTEVSYEMGSGEFVEPILNNPNNLAVYYYSDNSNVARVDENGAVEIVGDGVAVITAASDATQQYGPGKASYVLTVIDPDVVYGADFFNTDCGFTKEGDSDAEVWTKADGEGMNFMIADGEGKVSEMGDYYLVSPAFTLDGKGNRISFFHFVNNLVDVKNQAQLVIREVGGSWSSLEIADYPVSGEWGFSGDIEIPAIYNGKDVQIGFRHSTNGTDYCGSWAVSMIKVRKFVPSSIDGANVDVLNDRLYDLQGRRVENPGTGVYIQKGKKFVIRK